MEKKYYNLRSEYQKIPKVLIPESESSLSPDQSPNHLGTSIFSDLKSLIDLINTTLLQSNIIYQHPIYRTNDLKHTINTLKYLIETMCDELKVLIRRHESTEVTSKSSIKHNFLDFNFKSNSNSEDLILNIIQAKGELVLNANDCENLSEILLGNLREYKDFSYKEKYQEMTDKAIIYGKILSNLRAELRLKDEHILKLEDNIERNSKIISHIVDNAKSRQNYPK